MKMFQFTNQFDLRLTFPAEKKICDERREVPAPFYYEQGNTLIGFQTQANSPANTFKL